MFFTNNLPVKLLVMQISQKKDHWFDTRVKWIILHRYFFLPHPHSSTHVITVSFPLPPPHSACFNHIILPRLTYLHSITVRHQTRNHLATDVGYIASKTITLPYPRAKFQYTTLSKLGFGTRTQKLWVCYIPFFSFPFIHPPLWIHWLLIYLYNAIHDHRPFH